MNEQANQNILQFDSSHLNAYSTGLLQGVAYNRLHTQLTKALYQFDVSIPEWKLLGQVDENPHVKLSTLAELLSYDPPMVTKLIKQLEKKNMLKREQDPIDERAKIVIITEQGKDLIKNAEPEVKKILGKLLHGVSREELLTYLKVLTIIVKNSQD